MFLFSLMFLISAQTSPPAVTAQTLPTGLNTQHADPARFDRPITDLNQIGLPNPNQHDRMFHLIHGTDILAESGTGYQAALILAAIAKRATDTPPGHQAARKLEQWGLDPDQWQQWKPEDVNQKVKVSGNASRPAPEVIHLDNLVRLNLDLQARQLLQSLQEDHREQLPPSVERYFATYGLPIDRVMAGLPDSLPAMLDQVRQAQQLRNALMRVWLSDPHAAQVALQLFQRLYPESFPPHPHLDEFRHRPLREVLEHASELAERERDAAPETTELLARLITLVAPNSSRSERWKSWLADSGNKPPANSGTTEDVQIYQPRDPESDLARPLFESAQVHSYDISLSAESYRALQEKPRQYVRGTFRHNDQTYENVGIALKGGAGSFRQLDGHSKVGLTIKFNQFEKSQRFHGLKRIVLNNAVQDPSYLNEYLGYQLFRDAGLPAPRVTHAVVHINQQPYGLYVQVEAATKDFLKGWFPDPDGNYYEGPGDVTDWEHLDLDTNQKDNRRDDLQRLADSIHAASEDDPWPQLSSLIDFPAFARFVAIEQFVGHWDGFSGTNNYRLYHRPDTDQFVWVPHGADQLFRQPEQPITEGQASILARALLQTRSGRAAYFQQLEDFTRQVWDIQRIKQRIAVAYLSLRPHVNSAEGEGHNSLEEFDLAIQRLIRFVELRDAVVESQLDQEQQAGWKRPRHHAGWPSFLRL